VAELLRLGPVPALERPVMVVSMEGWIDAGQAATVAMSALVESMPTEPLATFDGDALIDYRARRPVLRIADGVDTDLRWPELRLDVATNRTGRSVLLLHGPEPDMRWQQFVAEIVAVTARLGVELVAGLGAFPAPVPHTRPVRLVGTSTDAELAARVSVIPATLDVPAGAQGALEHALGSAGVPALGLWARVPHYASALPYPAAAAALLDELGRVAGLDVDTKALHAAAGVSSGQIDQLIAGSEDHAALVRQLERQHDEEQGFGTAMTELPSGDEIAAELERFLRGER
jgi:predicted ATP-grasp superfamily ATP-dependent carboligase